MSKRIVTQHIICTLYIVHCTLYIVHCTLYKHKLTQVWLKEHRIEFRLHSSLHKSLNLHWYNIMHIYYICILYIYIHTYIHIYTYIYIYIYIYPGRKSQATSTQTHKGRTPKNALRLACLRIL